MGKVIIDEHYTLKAIPLQNFIISKGYKIARGSGHNPDVGEPKIKERGHFGIVRRMYTEKASMPRKTFFGWKRPECRNPYIGHLFLDETKPLSLKVYGRNNLEDMTALAEEISKEFDLDVSIGLQTEEQKEELFWVDLYYYY